MTTDTKHTPTPTSSPEYEAYVDACYTAKNPCTPLSFYGWLDQKSDDAEYAPDNWNRLAYSQWDKRLKPVTNALLKNQSPVVVQIDGWTFRATKAYRSPLYQGPGPAWFANVRATKEGEYPIEGSRDDVISHFVSINRPGAKTLRRGVDGLPTLMEA